MRTMKLGSSSLEVPVVAVGCMRLNGLDKVGAEKFVQSALEEGANFFDHANIYGEGTCEEIFAEAIHMSSTVREKIILQSKCGIHREAGTFDFSKKHILESVDSILKRLKTEYLDVLLLHRPDILMEPEEIAEAFDLLHSTGKVRHFGVSNQTPMQMKLLQKSLHQPIIANQIQLSIMHATALSHGIYMNIQNEGGVDRDGGVVDYCRFHDITVQAWSPFQHGFFQGVFLDNPQFPELNKKIDEVASKYSVTNTTIAMAWLLRHPAKMQPVSGTMNIGRLKDICKAADITLTREEWYQIFIAAGNKLP